MHQQQTPGVCSHLIMHFTSLCQHVLLSLPIRRLGLMDDRSTCRMNECSAYIIPIARSRGSSFPRPNERANERIIQIARSKGWVGGSGRTRGRAGWCRTVTRVFCGEEKVPIVFNRLCALRYLKIQSSSRQTDSIQKEGRTEMKREVRPV
jgi:hypothetical protein